MVDYDLVEKMNSCFTQLQNELAQLHQQLLPCSLLGAAVFVLPDIEKGTEHDPIDNISVKTLMGDEARQRALRHFSNLFIHHNKHNISSKAAVRLPGVICLSAFPHQQLLIEDKINLINQLKAKLEKIITVDSGLPSEQRFEFVHTHLRGLITLNTYRSLTLLKNPSSVRFGWANKQIIKNIQRDELLAQLNRSLQAGRSVPPFSREEWQAIILDEIREVKALPANATLKIKRPVKVQPIARVWYQPLQKQIQHPCSMPLIALCDPGHLPVLGELSDYDAKNIKHRYKPSAKPLHLISKRLHLYTDAVNVE